MMQQLAKKSPRRFLAAAATTRRSLQNTTHHHHHQRRCFTAQESLWLERKQAMDSCHAPKSIASIPSRSGDEIGDAGAAIRDIGNSRRVFLLNHYLSPDELEGLAYRIRALTTNSSLSSILVATDDDDPREDGVLPAMLLDDDRFRDYEDFDSHLFDPKPNEVWFAAGGYDPLEWFKSNKYKDPVAVSTLLDSISDLASATRGHHSKTRIPVITIPHGAIADSGYALCMASYMIATEQTHFHIKNPSRGLTFDPVGFSYMLPRLGQEFKQEAAQYRCDLILALMGYQAKPVDLMETGLATHYMENPTVTMGMLERTLAGLRPFDQQRVIKTPTLGELEYTQREFETPEQTNFRDPHRFARNVSLAATIKNFTEYAAWPTGQEGGMEDTIVPAAFDMDALPWLVDDQSYLVVYAATFDEILKRPTVEGILDGFREVAARKTNDPEEQEGIDVANQLVGRMEMQSPLALRVTHKLLELGKGRRETLATCMAREKSAQAKMMTKPDFENWGKAQVSISTSRATPMWQHMSVEDVMEDEVSEIVAVEQEEQEQST